MLKPGEITARDAAWDFVTAPPNQAAKSFSALLAALRGAIAAGFFDDAASALRIAAGPSLGYTQAQSFFQISKTLRGKIKCKHKIKIAILGSFTAKQVLALMDLFLFVNGVEANFMEGEFGTFRQDIIDPASDLYSFAPDFLFIATTARDLSNRPNPVQSLSDLKDLAAAEIDQWKTLWATAHERCSCQIIQNNFAAPPHRLFANHEKRLSGSFSRFVTTINDEMTDAAPAYVTIHDVDHLAATAGRWRWDDPRFFHQAKLPCNPECLVDYAHSASSIILAQLGLSKKCLVLDLDNTLWGGVIGDDGLGGIRLGQGNAEGEAFLEFQQYAQGLRNRGVLLAICSKNTESVAMEVFEKHSEMILRKSDISCFTVNWEDKAANLRRIAAELNIGIDSLVFVDDNPAERSIVRQLVPDVSVPELPDDVSGYIRAIESNRYFQVVSVSGEDFQRTEFYKADSMRRQVETSASDIATFLSSLGMVARVGSITPETLERSAQLIQRSNQFNLTTRRRSASELAAIMAHPGWITRTISLTDRFGDNGLISVLLAEIQGDCLEIDTWLMSCRVLKRGVEQFLLKHIYKLACQNSLGKIRGTYLPTSKNSLVKDHYLNLGFLQTSTGEGGQTVWELPVTSNPPQFTTFINERT